MDIMSFKEFMLSEAAAWKFDIDKHDEYGGPTAVYLDGPSDYDLVGNKIQDAVMVVQQGGKFTLVKKFTNIDKVNLFKETPNLPSYEDHKLSLYFEFYSIDEVNNFINKFLHIPSIPTPVIKKMGNPQK